MLWLAPMKLPGRDLPERQPVADGRAGAHPAARTTTGSSRWAGAPGSASTSASTWARRPRPAQALQEAGAALGRRVHEARLRRLLAPRPSTTPSSTSAAAGRSRSSPSTSSRMPGQGPGRDGRRSWPRSGSRPGRSCAPSGPSATGWAAGARRREFLSPKLWDRFVWPYMKELVEIVAEEGGTPVLHYDANWDREIERLLELPARTLRARNSTARPTSSGPRRSWPGTCASWATCPRRC